MRNLSSHRPPIVGLRYHFVPTGFCGNRRRYKFIAGEFIRIKSFLLWGFFMSEPSGEIIVMQDKIGMGHLGTNIEGAFPSLV